MKTNTIKTVSAAAAIASIALIAMTKDSTSLLTVMAVIVSYTAVALLSGLAVMDYGVSSRGYRAS